MMPALSIVGGTQKRTGPALQRRTGVSKTAWSHDRTKQKPLQVGFVMRPGEMQGFLT
jgi:hypothetical protein